MTKKERIIRNIIVFIIIVIGIMALGQAQEKDPPSFALSVQQDAKLAVLGDDRGNLAFTLDMIVNVEWRGFYDEIGYFSLIPNVEKANLDGGDYWRYGVDFGYTFDDWLEIPDNPVIGQVDVKLMPYVGFGWISRKFVDGIGEDNFGNSWSAGIDLTFQIFEKVGLVANNRWVRRTDLIMYWGDEQFLNYSFYFGFKYEF